MMDKMLAELIAEAEGQFGPRDTTWSLPDVLIGGWNYPETLPDRASGRITVRITEHVRGDPERMRYQLAHEAVHCLAPVRRPDTIYFEEGLAVEFALRVSGLSRAYRRRCKKQFHAVLRKPHAAFCALGATDEDIRRLREEQPCFDNFDAKLLARVLGIPSERAEAVCVRMALTRPDAM